MKNILKKGMSGLMAVLVCLTTFIGIGATPAFAASETAESYMVSYPRDGDAVQVYDHDTWGHSAKTYMNGWYTGASTMTTIHCMDSYDGKVCYCIEPGIERNVGDTYTKFDENFWDNYPSSLNKTIEPYGVEVFFINDNIKTFDGDGELRLTIMATLAQDESRKTSIRVKAGQQTSMNNGVFYGNGNILGYDRVDKNTFVINPEQAETVRMIYDMYLSGMGVTKIQYELEKAGRLTATGKERWFASYISHMLRNSFYCGIITYHKEYTPDYLKQKKIKNDGVMEYTQVKGTHTPIVTEEEFARVQEILAQKSIKSGKGKNARKVGHKPHSTVWGRLMICQCGKHFNMHFHDRKDRDPGVDYQCYTSVNRGSPTERKKRGLSVTDACDTPFIPGWKMEMMASHLFKKYICNAEDTLQLAYSLLEQHIDDQEEVPDNSDAIRRKQSEIDKLNKKLANLIEMREDGDIDKEYFRERKKEIEGKINRLAESIKNLTPIPAKDIAGDYSERLSELKKKLGEYTDFDGLVIPESIVEAFIQKIWVSKDEFRWYLRTNRSGSAEEAEHIQIGSFTLTLEDAKAYQYSFSTRKRIYNWEDLNVTVWI